MTKQCDELLPCPFCGGAAVPFSAMGESWIRCGPCGAGTEMNGIDAEAIAAWNRRAAPRPTGEAVAWQAKMIDGQWRVGLRGNLDTVHDATITVHKHGEGDIDRHIAEWVADAHNADLAAPPAQSADSGGELWEIGSWLSAALDDPKVCDEMKAAITSWFEGGGYLRQALAQPAPQDDFSPFSQEAKIPTAQADGGCSGNEGAA